MTDEKISEPVKPGLNECCGGNCAPCVWDTYYEEHKKWRDAQAAKDKPQAEDVPQK